MDHHWYAVRCCCTPSKILGFMRVEDGIEKFNVISGGIVHKIELKTIRTSVMSKLEEGISEDGTSMSTVREIAIYSNDHPIEFWRQVSGFIEIKGLKDT